MDRIKDYAARAAEARMMAETALDATVKEGFRKIAEEYERMVRDLSRTDK